ncbi:MAG: type II secretion system F family protein [Gaiellaceae bacterium]
MSRRRLAVAGLALTLLAFPAAAAAAVQLRGVDASAYPTIRASVVLPVGTGGVPIMSENGRGVAGLQLQNLGRAKAIPLLIDRSQSMRGKPLADAIAGARAFVRAKGAADEISVVAFGSAALTLSPFSTVKLNADAALAGIKPDPFKGTALYDAITIAARQIASNPLPGRVIIVLSDGADNASHRTIEAAKRAAHAANAAVYTIGLEGAGFDPAALLDIASSTGGQYFGASSTAELRSVYASIAATLKRTWRVQYVTAARPGDRIELGASVVGQGSVKRSLSIPRLGATAPAQPSKIVPKGAYGPGGPLGLAVLVGTLVLLAALFFLTGMRGSWVRARIAMHVGDTKQASKKTRKERRLRMLASVFRTTEKALGDLKQWRWLSTALERADVPLRTVEFFWIEVGAVAGIGLFAMLFRIAAPVMLALMMVAGTIPFAIVWLKMRKRIRAFEDQLPDLLITIAASLKAGHSFKQGLQAVVDEGQPPAAEEIKRVLTETSLGRPMDDALSEMADRVGSENFNFAITAVTIQRQVGGSLASLFDMVADTVRQRQLFARKIRALTAMGRMSAYTLIGIPFFIATMLTIINGGYMSPLYSTGGGHLMIGIALAMMAFGSLILKKIVSFRG